MEKRAVYETLGRVLKPKAAKIFFLRVYKYLLYHDTESFLKAMEFRKNIDRSTKTDEAYLVFKYMLQLLKKKHPGQLDMLFPQ